MSLKKSLYDIIATAHVYVKTNIIYWQTLCNKLLTWRCEYRVCHDCSEDRRRLPD